MSARHAIPVSEIEAGELFTPVNSGSFTVRHDWGCRPEEAMAQALIAMAWRGCLAIACSELCVNEAAALMRPLKSVRSGASETFGARNIITAHRWAIYLLNTELGVPQPYVAQAAGVSRPAVLKICRAVEDAREEPGVERALTACSAQVQEKMKPYRRVAQCQ